MASLILKRGKERRVLSGHPWVYAGEVDHVKGAFESGDIVEIRDCSGHFLARGYANQICQIMARILTCDRDEKVDAAFLRRRVEGACSLRKVLVPHNTDACRLIYSEADLLPGLIVDQYGTSIVVQFLTAGMERMREDVLGILTDLLRPSCVYERSDVSAREREGLTARKGPISGVVDNPVMIAEGGRSFLVDIADGQKTGFFLDQRENRSCVAGLARSARVLDAFCYTGGFSVSAAAAGASEVIGIDIGDGAVALATRNAELNGCSEHCRFEVGNAFDILREYDENRDRFGLIILDPPSFTRAKHGIEGAVRGYKEINLRALRMVSPGGYIVTCSCSYHIGQEMFEAIVLDASRDAHRTVRLVEARSQAKDHPVLLAARETRYLKCLVLHVL